MTRHSLDSLEIANSDLDWQALNGATVLITGGGGFLGSAIVESLLARHDLTEGNQPKKVIALVRSPERAKKRLGGHAALEIFEQDLCLPTTSLPSFDYVIHAASQASPRFYGSDPVGTMLPNTWGTQNLLEKARKIEAKGFLFVSSGEVYGQVPPENVPTKENEYGFVDPTHVRSCYAESKRCGETLCVSYAHQFGLRTTIARPFHTYGPGIDLNDGRVFADFVRDIVERKNIVLRSDGLARRAFCYVTDAVRGLLTVLLSGDSGAAYNVGNPDNEVSVGALAELLVGLFPERQLKVEYEARTTDTYLASPIARNSPDITKLKSLGWTPVVNLAEGFTRTVRGIEMKIAEDNAEMTGARCS